MVERISNGSIRIIVPAKITFTGHFPIGCREIGITERYGRPNRVDLAIIDIAIAEEFIIAASFDTDNSNISFQEGSLEIGVTVTRFILALKILMIFKHGRIVPVIVHFTSEPKTGPQVRFRIAFPIVLEYTAFIACIAHLDLASHTNMIRILFEFCYSNSKIIELIGKFTNKLIISTDSSLSQCLCNNLGHFITGHGTVAFIGAVRIAIDNPCRGQLGNRGISPMTSGNVRKRIGCKCRAADSQGKNQGCDKLFFHCFLLLHQKNGVSKVSKFPSLTIFCFS